MTQLELPFTTGAAVQAVLDDPRQKPMGQFLEDLAYALGLGPMMEA